MTDQPAWHKNSILPDYILPAGIGILLGVIVSLLLAMELELQWTLALFLCLATPFVAMVYGDMERFCLILFLFFLPLNISTLIGHTGEPIPHAGGALNSIEFYLIDVPLVALYIFWFGKSFMTTHRIDIRFTKIDAALLAFIAWSIVTTVSSVSLDYSFFEIIRLAHVYLIYLYFANRIKTRNDLRLIVTFLALGVIVQFAICLLSYKYQLFFTAYGKPISFHEGMAGLTGLASSKTLEDLTFEMFNLPKGWFRAGGTVGPFNVEAMYLGFVIPPFLALWILYPNNKVKIVSGFSFLCGVAASILTFSRGGWISLALSTMIILGVCYRRGLLSRRIKLALVLVAFFGAIVLFGTPSFREKMLFRLLFKTPEVAIYPRIEMMHVSLRMLLDNPVLGVGINNYLAAVPAYYAFGDKGFEVFPVHNRYLLVAVETGLIGLVIFLTFLFGSLLNAIRSARSKDPFYFALGIGVFGGFVGIMFHMLVDICSNFVLLVYMAIFSAMVVVINRLDGIEQSATVRGRTKLSPFYPDRSNGAWSREFESRRHRIG